MGELVNMVPDKDLATDIKETVSKLNKLMKQAATQKLEVTVMTGKNGTGPVGVTIKKVF